MFFMDIALFILFVSGYVIRTELIFVVFGGSRNRDSIVLVLPSMKDI